MGKLNLPKLTVLLVILTLMVSSNLSTITVAGDRYGGPETSQPQTEYANTNHASTINGTSNFDWSANALAAYTEGESSAEIIIGTDNSYGSKTEIASFANQNGGTITDTISMGTKNALVVSIPINHASEFVDAVHASGVSSYIELNGKYQVSAVPNDPYWNLQWGTKRVSADFAWNTTVGNSDLIVAVIDTGIDYNHTDLAGCYVGGYDFVNNDNDPKDDHGHGTHCAGIIAAAINNNIGIAGVAQVKIMAMKGLSVTGSGAYTALANCIINATNAGADILSNSWGGSLDSSLISDAIYYATQRGVLVLVAAGNENRSTESYPAMYSNVVAVAASNVSDTKASFSNYGSWVDVAAPGVMIYSTMPTYYVTMNDRYTMSYSYCSGTSMACPMTAGVAALIWSTYPNMDAEAVRAQLESTCDDVGAAGFDIYFGNGVVNAFKGVTEPPVQSDLEAKAWNAPSYLMLNKAVVLNLTTANRGAQEETNVEVQLLVNGSIINSATIASMSAYATNSYLFSWTPTQTGTYNLSYVVTPSSQETNLANNIISATYTVITAPDETNWTPLVTNPDYNIGCTPHQAYSQLHDGVVFFKVSYYHNWTIAINDIDTGIMIDSDQNASTGMPLNYYWAQENCMGAEYMILVGNEGNEIWCWNSTIRGWDSEHLNLLYLEAPDNSNTFVVGVSAADIEVEGFFDCSFNDITQVSIDSYYWNWMPDTGYVPFSAQNSPDDLSVTLETERIYAPNAPYTLIAKVFNYGQLNESNVKLNLLIDGQLVNSTIFSNVASGNFAEVRYSWTTTNGYFNITAYVAPLSSESITANNLRTRFVPVSEIIGIISENIELWTTLNILDAMNINYNDYYYNYYYGTTTSLSTLNLYPIVIYYNDGRSISSTELSALNQYLANGGKLIITGYDSLYYSDARLAQVVRAISSGDDNNQPDLYVTNSSHPIMNGPYGTFATDYHISGLKVDNDAIEANITARATTIAELADGKDKIIATENLPGTVVYWNGIGTDNWLNNPDCQAMFKNTLIWLLGASAPATNAEYDGLWRSSAFTITLSAESEYGVAQTFYRINGGATKTVSTDGQPQITQESANNTLEYWSTDIYGNQEAHRYLQNIKLDITNPIVSMTINNGATYTNSIAVGLNVSASDSLSGISQARYTDDGVWDNETWQTYAANQSFTLSSGDTNKTVYAQVKDNAGLIAQCSAWIVLDTTAPTANAGSSKTITVGDSVMLDGTGSADSNGLASYNWTFGDGSTGSGAQVSHTYNSIGTYTATLNITDSAGNSAQATATVYVNAKSSASSSLTPTPKPTTNPTPTPTPTVTTTPDTINATINTGTTVELTIGGNITSSQISNAQIHVNQTAATTTLSFNISGEAGSTGFGNITIPKNQVPVGTSPVIYIDGVQAEQQGYTKDENNFYIWYTTHFSTHEVSIVFTELPIKQTEDNSLWVISAVIIAVSIVCVLVVFLYWQKRTKW